MTIVLLIGACSKPLEPEQALREALKIQVEHLQEGDVGGFMEAIADDFVGQSEGLDRERLRGLLRLQLLRSKVSVTLSSVEVELHGENRASVRFTALALGSSGGWLPSDGRVFRVDSSWRREGQRWTVIAARWE